ncbi:MAG: CDP-2,3-bis-(O-geranylgeranyl)-sn-glycerol synthase [Candidatus Thermoplasmatota archaeon]
MDIVIFIQAMWIIIPAYVANASAVLVGGGKPIDLGKKWRDDKRILGDGKTWQGLISGSFIGMTAGFGLSIVAKYASVHEDYAFLGLTDFLGCPVMIPIIFSICFGALTGDIIESFFKRRLGKKRGEDWIPFDQLDFILGALFFSFIVSGILSLSGITVFNWFFENLTFWHIVSLLIITPFIHLIANLIHKKKIRKMVKKVI